MTATLPVPMVDVPAAPSGAEWWRGATIYQIYPRSFADANGDGVGDLAGITSRLDHVTSLHADAIWISPFFPSPMADFGYDVADYCDVDPIFGTLADFDVLVARAHVLGLRVMIDLVFAHTSDQHAWFADSRTGRNGPRADWYVWADPRPDGTPPNNWQSVFGGPGWTWDARRRQYYMHQFLKEQPQLNAHNPAVQDALLAVIRFWLERGVDGFRFDALNHAMFDPELRDNGVAAPTNAPRNRSFNFQDHRHSQNHPSVVGFIERIREQCDAYGAVFTVAEVGGPETTPLMKAYTAGDARLSSAYSFEFLYADQLTPVRVKAVLECWLGEADPLAPSATQRAEGWPSWAFENHDAPRAVSRWAPAGADRATMDAYCRMEIALLAALRGNVFLYQGQELGLVQDEIPYALLKDPEAIANWPLTLSRDGVRTPMPWNDAAHEGFTTGTPWLPLSPANIGRAVAGQDADATSVLHWTRAVIALRQALPALRLGALSGCEAAGDVLRFERSSGGETIACAFNLGSQPVALASPAGEIILAANGATPAMLPGFGALWVRCRAKGEG